MKSVEGTEEIRLTVVLGDVSTCLVGVRAKLVEEMGKVRPHSNLNKGVY
jgi:hypothetical protein